MRAWAARTVKEPRRHDTRDITELDDSDAAHARRGAWYDDRPQLFNGRQTRWCCSS